MKKQSSRSPVRAAVCVALSFYLAPSAAADETRDFARKGPYMEWAVSYAHFLGLEDELNKTAGPGIEVTDGVGGDLSVGYRFTNHLALDGQFTYVGIGDAQVNNRSIAQFEFFSLMMNGRAYALTGRVQPYFIGGIGWQYANIDNDQLPGVDDTSQGFAFKVGAGADFYLNRHFALTAAVTYLRGVGDVSDYDTLQARAGWMFRY